MSVRFWAVPQVGRIERAKRINPGTSRKQASNNESLLDRTLTGLRHFNFKPPLALSSERLLFDSTVSTVFRCRRIAARAPTASCVDRAV